MKYLPVILFFFMILLQWFVPLSMIKEQESILAEGTLFKFRTEPIDPSDPFRGKYITLNFDIQTIEIDTTVHWKRNDDIYVILKKDSAGFAAVKDISQAPPADTDDFIKSKVHYEPYGNQLNIRFPFERFYMEESKASEAERIYWQANSDTSQIAYAVVKVKQGNAALEDVMINNRSLKEIIDEINISKE